MKYLIPIFEFVESYSFEDGGLQGATYYYFFSDGNNQFRVEAQDYVWAFQQLVNPESKSRDAENLLALKNAKKILIGNLMLGNGKFLTTNG